MYILLTLYIIYHIGITDRGCDIKRELPKIHPYYLAFAPANITQIAISFGKCSYIQNQMAS